MWIASRSLIDARANSGGKFRAGFSKTHRRSSKSARARDVAAQESVRGTAF
jgi:hypothetical protein